MGIQCNGFTYVGLLKSEQIQLLSSPVDEPVYGWDFENLCWCSYLLRQSMPRIQGASRPVPPGCFSHLSPVKLTLVSNTDSSWQLPVPPEIQMGSALLCLDGISVHCAPVSTKAFYFCASDVPGHQIHTVQYVWSSLSSSWPKAGTLYSCSWLGNLCDARSKIPSQLLNMQQTVILLQLLQVPEEPCSMFSPHVWNYSKQYEECLFDIEIPASLSWLVTEELCANCVFHIHDSLQLQKIKVYILSMPKISTVINL